MAIPDTYPYTQTESGLYVRPELKADALSDFRHPTAWLQSWALGARTHSGIEVSPQSALTFSAYFAAVRAISEDVAKVPLITYERLLPRGKRRAYEHAAYALLHDAPNVVQGSMTWRETMTAHALTWGGGYSEIIRSGPRIIGFSRPAHPSRVSIFFNEEGELTYRIFIGDTEIRSKEIRESQAIDFPARDILHLHGLGDGLQGYSVVEYAAESLGVALAAQRFGAAFFGNGTHLSGVLTHPASLSPTARENLRDSWTQKYSGVDNISRPAILEEGMKWEPIGMPMTDAQFLETRSFQVHEIARWFRIPPHKLAALENATFSNIEHQAIEYIGDSLLPWWVRWEQELQRKVFTTQPDFFAEHAVQGLLRGDSASRSALYRVLFYLGALSPNDIRELENLNPIVDENGELDPAGDMYFIQNNLATLGTIAGTREPIRTVTQNGQQFALVPMGAANGHATSTFAWDET